MLTEGMGLRDGERIDAINTAEEKLTKPCNEQLWKK